MKKLLLFITLIASSVFVMGQSFELTTPEGEVIPNGGTINVSGDASSNLIAAHVHVKNIANETKRAFLEKVIIKDVEGSYNTFCWAGSCYGPDTYVSPTPAEIEAGATNTEFAGDYQPMGAEDILTVKYIWFDESDTTDMVYIYVNFNTEVERSLALTNDDGEFIDGQTIEVEGMVDTEVILESVRVINFASEAADVKVMKMINEGDTVPGSQNTFYWDIEYTPEDYESAALTIDTLSTHYNFIAQLLPNETSGISTISYKFFNANNTEDYVTITVEFDVKQTGINEGIELASISGAYPNPADKLVNFDINKLQAGTNARIIIRNLLGEIVKEEVILANSKSINMNVSDLEEGLYVYPLIINDKIESTKKLVVRH